MSGMSVPVRLPASDARVDPALEAILSDVETRLASLGDALRERDPAAIDMHATGLHRALASAVDRFTVAARSGTVPVQLRHRLARAGGQVAAQRESLARATAALDRAIDVLMPREAPALYSSMGNADRAMRGGSIQA